LGLRPIAKRRVIFRRESRPSLGTTRQLGALARDWALLYIAPMTVIADSDELAGFCRRQAQAAYVTVDTEFMRDRTFWPILCLVQIAGPEEAAAIDPLAAGIDLTSLFALMADTHVLKVFHAARQDIEIFVNLAGAVPTPLFDTQVAAMVCGFGESP